jgi:hypothetical protein
VQTKDGNSINWHHGGTGGYRSDMGYDSKARVGVVVLSNGASPAGHDDIGRHLLDASDPLDKVELLKEHKEVPVDSQVFDNHVGSYQLAPNAIRAITRESDQCSDNSLASRNFSCSLKVRGSFS